LAKHKTEPRWLVIELKRSQGSDDTLGQIQCYMGWVMEELADDGDKVEGLIIAAEQSEKLRFAMKATQKISFKRYEVDFRLA
jgi:RecB family endonuclease NucS